jgi:hypothetical protein
LCNGIRSVEAVSTFVGLDDLEHITLSAPSGHQVLAAVPQPIHWPPPTIHREPATKGTFLA